jgi:hypothetical protein
MFLILYKAAILPKRLCTIQEQLLTWLWLTQGKVQAELGVREKTRRIWVCFVQTHPRSRINWRSLLRLIYRQKILKKNYSNMEIKIWELWKQILINYLKSSIKENSRRNKIIKWLRTNSYQQKVLVSSLSAHQSKLKRIRKALLSLPKKAWYTLNPAPNLSTKGRKVLWSISVSMGRSAPK